MEVCFRSWFFLLTVTENTTILVDGFEGVFFTYLKQMVKGACPVGCSDYFCLIIVQIPHNYNQFLTLEWPVLQFAMWSGQMGCWSHFGGGEGVGCSKEGARRLSGVTRVYTSPSWRSGSPGSCICGQLPSHHGRYPSSLSLHYSGFQLGGGGPVVPADWPGPPWDL